MAQQNILAHPTIITSMLYIVSQFGLVTQTQSSHIRTPSSVFRPGTLHPNTQRKKPPPAISLTEGRRNQSPVSARSVMVLSRIRRTLVCLTRRIDASCRGALLLKHGVPNSVQASCKTPDAEDNPRGSSTVFDRHCCTPTRQPNSRDGREIGCQRPMEGYHWQPHC